MRGADLITIDPEILGGEPVFKGTRVSVSTLFDTLEDGFAVQDFLENFPTVTREQALAVIAMSREAVLSDAA